MADTITNYDSNTEPATKHDVSEGGIIGAVGGAIVGALAGGPIGAVIGAVVGGAASAGAVDVVDKHDHDYDRTAYANSADDVDMDDEVVTDDLRGNRVVEPVTTYNDTTYAPAAVTTGTAYTERDAVVTAPSTYADSTSYANTTALRDNGDQVVVPVVEEELLVGKRVEQTGGAHVHTEVTERPVSESVNLREEHVTVDRRPVDRAATDADFKTGTQDFSVTESREVPIVAKEARVIEEVVIGKTASERTETINDTVRRTDVVVDDVEGKKSSTY